MECLTTSVHYITCSLHFIFDHKYALRSLYFTLFRCVICCLNLSLCRILLEQSMKVLTRIVAKSRSLNAIYPVPVLKMQTLKCGIHLESLAKGSACENIAIFTGWSLLTPFKSGVEAGEEWDSYR